MYTCKTTTYIGYTYIHAYVLTLIVTFALGSFFDAQVARVEAVCLFAVDGGDSREVESLDVCEHARH